MSTIVPQPVTISGARFEETSTTALFAVGEACEDSWGGKWKYVQAQGALSINSVGRVDNDGQLVPLTTALSGTEPTMVGIPQVAFADNAYGWVFVGPGGGVGSGIKVLARTLCATNVKLYTTDTAGPDTNVDDSATDLIAGLTLCTTNAAGGTVATECFAATTMCTNCQD